jgi:hypothetical protein
MKIIVGSKVAYSVQWLRSIGEITGELPQARGIVTNLICLGQTILAEIKWLNGDYPNKVNVANLAIVGTNNKFSNCSDHSF